MFNLDDFKRVKNAIRRDGKRVRFVAHIPDAAAKDNRLLSITDDGLLQFNGEDGMFLPSRGTCDDDLINVGYAPHKISFTVPEPLATMPIPGDVVNVITGPIWDPYIAEVVWDGCVSTIFEKGLIWATREEAETALAAFAKGYR